MVKTLQSNFTHLQEHDEQLLRLGLLAERYFADDPNTCLLKLRQLTETLAQMLAASVGISLRVDESQYHLLHRLRDQGILPHEIFQLFTQVRIIGNDANHALKGTHRDALAALRYTWQISVWFHRAFKQPKFKSGPFVPPSPPKDEAEDLRLELADLLKALADHQFVHQETTQQLLALQQQLQAARDEKSFWEELAAEVEAEKAGLKERLAAEQTAAASKSSKEIAALVTASTTAASALELDEAQTRRLIDQQLRDAGWTVDTVTLRYGSGARPQKGQNLAIAEWPTATGPADYVLFIGLTPIAAVEAKRGNIQVAAALQQAKRYSRGFIPSDEVLMHEQNWGKDHEFRLPFAFSTNGRPYLRQLLEKSGTWFCDLRRPNNHTTALQGWFTPEDLSALLKQDIAAAHQQLAAESFDFGFVVRYYQQLAVLKTEAAIASGQQAILIAMATGTGKTKTCIALIYRLLKTKRFRRILFLVDRSALGEQAANAFKDTRMESLQSFADAFGIKEIDQAKADSDTAVHIATVQGMVQRVLYPSESNPPPSVGEYDCIIVDECHRGYTLDRELSETELSFRSFDDYFSTYRRVLDYFAAVKIGLTATPALHTTEIFGPPVYAYTYREAVIDGYLVDYEPPYKIETELSREGIKWKKGEDVHAYSSTTGEVELFKAPDELKFDVEEFNRKVITEPFNQVVCDYLATEIDPASRQKTLVFCVSDIHADMVVRLLKAAFKKAYGDVDDDAVMKITGTADKPLQLIRRYKNEGLPSVAVTVDLLTTGVDVPEICNLVFLRRVNSRILFDQMLGRATRLCDEIGKETFRVFDAVRLFEALEKMTAMKPVVVNPNLSFSQLIAEVTQVGTDEARSLIRDQIISKLRRKKRHLGETGARDFEVKAGMTPDAFLERMKTLPPEQVAAWFTQHPGLGEILDRTGGGPTQPILIADHADSLHEVTRGFGASATQPQDYLAQFKTFIDSRANDIPALITVVTRPQSLTRKELRVLQYELDKAGFSEASLDTAWKQLTNQEIAARIIGYIRQAALGDPLKPFSQRVDEALQSMLATRQWTNPQRDWLKRLAAQTKANLLVDRAALDDPVLIFKREGGGFNRLDKIFDGRLQHVLETFNSTVWKPAA
jgi:type I restriction enzyme R subunit